MNIWNIVSHRFQYVEKKSIILMIFTAIIKVLSTLKDKVEKQEELTDDDQAKLVFLADMNINLPIKKLMIEKDYIITHANIPEDDKKDLLACHIQELNRFFKGDEMKKY